jgi:tetratricopeptide (TPR) repeat protein
VNFISRWFSKSPAELMSKGDKYMESDSHFDARTCYEDGLKACSDSVGEDLKPLFAQRIEEANCKLAERNIIEAESAYARGDVKKAVDHLELVKTLTYDQVLREKAEGLLQLYSSSSAVHEKPSITSSCNSCSGSSGGECTDSVPSDDSLAPMEYYVLLIQQLPGDQSHRYAELGEEFAYAYIAASRDEHYDALAGFEKCINMIPQDIYCYEAGKVQHRLGNEVEAEKNLRFAVQLNRTNSLAWLNLALMLLENGRFQDALTVVDTMVNERIMSEQALLIRAEIYEINGDHEKAINLYVELLQTPYSHAAAEKLYVILMEVGRPNDAAVIFKKYMKKSCH